MFDEPLGDDTKPRYFDVTFSNPLSNFNDDFTVYNDNPLFDEEFKDINTDLPLGEPLDTLLTGDREIDFNPSRDIEELERLLADDPVPVPRVFDDPLGNSDPMSRSIETSDLILEEITTEIGLDDLIPTKIDDRYYDSEGDILVFDQFLNEDTSSDVSPTLLPLESSLLVLPLPDPKHICLREVERFVPFFSLTQSGGTTRVMETPSFSFHHMSSPRPAAYSPKEVMIPFDLEDLCAYPFVEIPSGESKVDIEVLSVLWGNRLPIPDSSLPLSRVNASLPTLSNASRSPRWYPLTSFPSTLAILSSPIGGFNMAAIQGCKLMDWKFVRNQGSRRKHMGRSSSLEPSLHCYK
ncbi:hypothetical protein Tco_0722686 [Tanacetum coccineum]